ncbi:MAG TPA: GNAT family N-acetyltransferase [Pirellulales bacterium]|nr:GNAT family N-acetyltransferase [Pirellulales bacterium]
MAVVHFVQYSAAMSERPVEPELKYEIGPAPSALKRTALERAFEALPLEQRGAAVDDLLASVSRGERSLEGLFAAWRGDDVGGALWTERHAGRTAGIWPPQLAAAAPEHLADKLLAHALAELESKNVAMVQCLALTDASSDAQRLRRAGFEHSCDLLYLVSQKGSFPSTSAGADLTFVPVEPTKLDHLAKLVERTYEGTLDCPAMDRRADHRRDCRDVLEGYRATCRGDLSHWFVVLCGAEEVGCLLLACDDRGQSWELVYMGIVPAARGRGLGIELVRHAQWLVARRSGERLVLAVDAANEPALNIYAAAGFLAWDKRSVFLKFLSPSSDPLPTR